MKKITFGIFIWFVVQLVVVSGSIASNSLPSAQVGYTCPTTTGFEAYVLGAIVPITEFTFIKGGWCWQK